jgi:hypothetical protein
MLGIPGGVERLRDIGRMSTERTYRLFQLGRLLGFEKDPPEYLEFIGIEDSRQTDISPGTDRDYSTFRDPSGLTTSPHCIINVGQRYGTGYIKKKRKSEGLNKLIFRKRCLPSEDSGVIR